MGVRPASSGAGRFFMLFSDSGSPPSDPPFLFSRLPPTIGHGPPRLPAAPPRHGLAGAAGGAAAARPEGTLAELRFPVRGAEGSEGESPGGRVTGVYSILDYGAAGDGVAD